MDVAVKYKIISEIIKSNDEQVLNAVKSLLNIEDNVDFLEEMTEEDQLAIDQGIKQLDSGEFISRELVREEVKNKFKF